MRIIGEIPHSEFKITVFQMNSRISVKLEKDMIEHTIKFRDGAGVNNIEDVKKFLDEEVITACRQSNMILSKAKVNSLISMQADEDEFEVII